MQRKVILFLLLIEFLGGALAGRIRSPFAGTWEGKVNDLPAIEINITDTGGKVSGEITFPFHQRNASGKWELKSSHSTPMLAVNVQGKTLTFETIHHKSHGSPELGPNVKFRIDLTGPDEARFFKIENPPAASAGLKLIRTQKRPGR